MSTPLIEQPLMIDLATKAGLDPESFKQAVIDSCLSEDDAGRITAGEFTAFLTVCRDLDLNPLLRQVYAFRKKGGGIQAIVGVDGWSDLINRHPQFDGITYEDHLEQSDPKKKRELLCITCQIYRKDRKHPVAVTEYMDECRRDTAQWKQWPARMLRHKATIQAARLAFGFAGIVDPDEAERIKGGRLDDATDYIPIPEPRATSPLLADAAVTAQEPAPEPKRGPGRPRKAPPAPPAPEPELQGATPTDAIIDEAADQPEEELFEWIDEDTGNVEHVPIEEFNRRAIEQEARGAAAEQHAALTQAREAAEAEKRRKREELQRQLDELSGAPPQSEPVTAEKQREANAALSKKLGEDPSAIPAFLRRGPGNTLPEAPKPDTGPAWPDALRQPEPFLNRLDTELAKLDDGDQMQQLWDRHVEPVLDEMFPPDQEEAQGIMRHHTKRVEP